MRSAMSRRGATKVEYALMLLLISVVCLLAIAAFGRNLSRVFGVVVAAQPTPAVRTAPDDPVKDDAGDGKKAKKAKPGGRGQPGAGNRGNDKAVGNAGSK